MLCAAGPCAAASRRPHALRLALTSQMKYGLPDAPAAKKRKMDKAASSNPAVKAVRAVVFACSGPHVVRAARIHVRFVPQEQGA